MDKHKITLVHSGLVQKSFINTVFFYPPELSRDMPNGTNRGNKTVQYYGK